MRLSICVFSFLLVSVPGLLGQNISKIQPSSAREGDPVEIVGSGFGSTPGKLTFGKKEAKPFRWTDTSIFTTVPRGVDVGHLTVTVTLPAAPGAAAAAAQSKADFTVEAPPFDVSHLQLITGVGATLAGLEATSYKVANDALSSANVGRKTPEILLGGGFILPWRRSGGWIEKAYCGAGDAQVGAARAAGQDPPEISDDCKPGGAYYHYRPWQAFVSIRFAPASDQTINGFVLGGSYRLTKYFSFIVGYSVTPVDEPSRGFRIAASQIVAANPTISPYSRYNANDILHADERPGVLDGFPLFIYDANGVTTQKLFPNSPTVTHYRSGIYFGVGIPLNLTTLFKPAAGK